MKFGKLKLIIGLFLIAGLIFTGLTGCSQKAAETTKEINFGYVQWPGVTVKTQVVKTIADYLGYETDTKTGAEQVVLKGMETGDLDVFLALWLPSMKVNYDPYKEKGVVEKVAANLENCHYITAVNKEAWDAGVKTFDDLKKFEDKFDKKIYGIEPGNDGNRIMKEKIIPGYNLEGWEVVVSGTAGMLSTVKSKTKKGEWVAFLGWQPHYMNVMFDMKYLKDPKNKWPGGGTSTVYTIIRTGFDKEDPNFYKFLKNFKLDTETQSNWIYEYKKGGKNEKGREPAAVAEEWIANNLDTVEKWVKGVKAVDGTKAIDKIREKVNNK
ncbi:MAG TPA: glycine betaine ABC transporter substrate-binding protein [Candidatus Mcinerneyibacterium sp.]|nr:glycine betaine ABC transporter substrate-binding protein [Candidatus Mcinerneyibacterium sp.]